MKKLLIILGLVSMMMLGTSAFAGNEIGFKAGLNIANLTDDAELPDSYMGIGGGIFYKIAMMDGNISFQPELLYMMKGDKVTEGNMEGKYKLSYLEIPVLVKYEIPTEGNFKPNVYLGPVLSILMSAKAEESDGTVTDEEDIKDFLKSADFGSTFGAGFGYKVGEKGMINFDVRYTLGLSNIIDDGSTDESKNNVFSFFLGYSMGVGM